MFVKSTVFAFLVASSLLVNADSEPERRQVDSVFNSITSAAASAITGGGASIFSDVTSVGGGVASDITSVAGGVFETVTSVGDKAITVVTSVGGEAITLATSGAGVATSFGGSIYSVATGAAASAASQATQTNVAVSTYSFGLTSSHAVGLVTVVGGALVGAMLTI